MEIVCSIHDFQSSFGGNREALKFPAVETISQQTSSAFIAPFHADFDTSTSARHYLNVVQYHFEPTISPDAFTFIARDTIFSEFKPDWNLRSMWTGVAPHPVMPFEYSSSFECEITCNKDTSHCFVIFHYLEMSEEAFDSRARMVIFMKGKQPGNISELFLKSINFLSPYDL